jgi:hypothetical protein
VPDDQMGLTVANEVQALREETVAPRNQSDALIALIARAASDPSMDVAKMQALFDLRQQVYAEEARQGWHDAMNRLQPKLPRISKTGQILTPSGAVRSTYAKIEDIDAACRPLYTAEGFSVRYTTETKDRILYVTCHVSRAGHTESTTMPVPINPGEHGNNAAQGMGVTWAYGRRYSFCAAFNIITVDGDTDGILVQDDPISERQIYDLEDMLRDTGSNTSAFLKYMGVNSLSEITQSNYGRAVSALKQKRRRREGA